MNRAEFIFAAIDVLFHPMQNYISRKGVKCEKNLSYDDRYADCKFDVYYKEGAKKPMPVIVNIHGGGFVKGDKKHRKSISHLYADRGWFVMNINYRLSPKYAFPDVIEDCIDALNYLPKLAEKYDLDLTKVVTTGDSAGAYAAAETEAVITNPALSAKLGMPECKVKPAGMVCFCGPYDLVAAMGAKLPFGLVRSIGESFLGMKLKKDFSNVRDYEYINEVSPSVFVNSDWCPTVLTMAKKDVFCKGHGEILFDKLKEAGVPVREAHSVKLIDNHCYHFNFWTKASKDTMKTVYEFLDELYAK